MRLRPEVFRAALSGAMVAGIVTRDAGRVALVFGAVLVADWLVSSAVDRFNA